MDILGIGFPELLFIFIIALMVFGPRRLPEIAGKAGRFVRDLRNMSQGFLAEWQREITVAARLEELQEVRKELEETKQSLQQTQKDVASDAREIGQSIGTVARTATTNPAPLTAEAKPASDTPAESLPFETSTETDPPRPASVIEPATGLTESSPSKTIIETNASIPETEKNGVVAKSVPTPVSPTEVTE